MENINSFIEINDDELDAIAGGNDSDKGNTIGNTWTCYGCGQVIQIKKNQDKDKHITKCAAARQYVKDHLGEPIV